LKCDEGGKPTLTDLAEAANRAPLTSRVLPKSVSPAASRMRDLFFQNP
jgi:hypothetical protein